MDRNPNDDTGFCAPRRPPPHTPHPSPPHAGQPKLHASASADGVQNLPSRWSMRLPFVTFIMRMPVGRGRSARDEVANKAIMSLLIGGISAAGPARCMNV